MTETKKPEHAHEWSPSKVAWDPDQQWCIIRYVCIGTPDGCEEPLSVSIRLEEI